MATGFMDIGTMQKMLDAGVDPVEVANAGTHSLLKSKGDARASQYAGRADWDSTGQSGVYTGERRGGSSRVPIGVAPVVPPPVVPIPVAPPAAFPRLSTLLNPTTTPVSQKQLIRMAEQALSPAGKAIMGDDPIPGFTGYEGAPTATFRQLSTLDQAEKDNLGTLLVNKHNVDYKTYEDRTKRQFIGQGFQPASRLLGYGI